MSARAWIGILLAAGGLAAASLAALPIILDIGQEWSGPVAGAGFTAAFLGVIIGASK